MNPAVSIIVSTYNRTDWLRKTLLGYQAQCTRDFELLIADDGSDGRTAELIENMRPDLGVPVQHIWQEDIGFRKPRILNKAILAARSDYLLFTDGDCIPRKDFVSTHLRHREPGRFLSGSCVRLPMRTSLAIDEHDIAHQRCFSAPWLHAHGLPRKSISQRITAGPLRAAFLDLISRSAPEFYGNNASCWREDALAVNGFDERLSYGGLDWEFGDRLKHLGVRPKQLRYRAICMHLDHDRGYADPVARAENQRLWDEVKRNRTVKAIVGIDTHLERIG